MHYENLVFGATVDSLLFALNRGYPLVYINARKPSLIDEENKKWEKAYFILSVSGLVKFSNKINKARLFKKRLSIVTHGKTFDVTFENLHIFDEKGLSGLPEPLSQTSDKCMVLDWMSVLGGTCVARQELLMGDGFVEKINFFQKSKSQNLVVTSTLTRSQIESQDYSELFCRFHVEDVLEYTLGRQIRLKSENREIYPLGKALYPEIEGVSFPEPPSDRDFSSSQPYLRYLLENFEHD